MIRFITFILLITTIPAILHKPLVWGFYEWNKEFVIETLCENKNKPEMHCDGKCFLEKQTSEDEDTAEKIILNVLKNIKQELFFVSNSNKNIQLSETNISYICEHLLLKIQKISTAVFHPPKTYAAPYQ